MLGKQLHYSLNRYWQKKYWQNLFTLPLLQEHFQTTYLVERLE